MYFMTKLPILMNFFLTGLEITTYYPLTYYIYPVRSIAECIHFHLVRLYVPVNQICHLEDTWEIPGHPGKHPDLHILVSRLRLRFD